MAQKNYFQQNSKRPYLKSIFCYAAIVFAGLLMAGCGASEKGKITPTQVRIAFTNIPLSYLPVLLAESLGYYREEGLSVTIFDFGSGTRTMQSLLGRSADIGVGSFDQNVQMAGEGRHVKSFVLVLQRPSRAILVTPKRKATIRRVEDLKGAVVGVGGFGSITHLFLNYVLAKHGMPADAVKIASIGTGATAIASIEHQSVDAAVVSGSDQIVIRKRSPDVFTLLDVTTASGCREMYGVDVYPAGVVYATENWLQEHPGTARQAARAIQRALTWISHHTPEEMWEAMPQHYRMDRQLDLEALRTIVPSFSHDGMMPAEVAEAVRKALSLSSEHVRSAKFDTAETYTNEFLSK